MVSKQGDFIVKTSRLRIVGCYRIMLSDCIWFLSYSNKSAILAITKKLKTIGSPTSQRVKVRATRFCEPL